MRQQSIPLADPQQTMQQTRIRHIYSGRFDLALTHVSMPRQQTKCHECPLQYIQITRHSFITYPKRSGQLTSIPSLTVVMRQHGPKTAQRQRGEKNTQLRQVALKIGADERVTPLTARLHIVRKQSTWKTAAQPASIQPVWLDFKWRNFIQRQPIQVVKNNPACQALGGV